MESTRGDAIARGSQVWPGRQVPLATEMHHGVPCPVYRDRPRSLTAILSDAVAAGPDREALVEVREDGTRRLNYGELDAGVRRLAAGLHRLGIAPGDRVGLLMVNSIPFCLTLFAIARLGAVAVPLNTKCRAAELEHALRDAGVVCLVMNPNWWESIEPVMALLPLRHIVVTEPAEISSSSGRRHLPDVAGGIPFNSLLDAGETWKAPPVPSKEHDPAIIMYTSGTTGAPKGAILSHWNLAHAVMSYADTLELGADERTAVAVPLFHVTGLIAQFLLMVHLVGSTVLLPTFHARRLLQVMQDERITFLHAAPTIYIMLLREPLFAAVDLRHWRVAAAGGAAMPPEVIELLAISLPQLRFHSVFGMTETSSPCTVMPPGEQRRHPASSGLPIPVMTVQVVDEEGRPLGPGQPGELLASGATVSEGYWGDSEATARTFGGGWLRTGDIAAIDEDGYVTILDRKKDMINRGAEKIYCVEVENVLHGHPGVVEAALVGIPDPVYGERVKAVVVPVPGTALSGEEIRTWVRARLAHFKAPDVVEFSNVLPRNPNGKVIKSLLR